MDLDPDPRSPKTCGSGGSGSIFGSESATLLEITTSEAIIHKNNLPFIGSKLASRENISLF
jgi:hypothetical protein